MVADSGFRSNGANDGRIPVVIVGGRGPGTLGMLRSFSGANIPVFLLDETRFTPAMCSRYGKKVRISGLSGLSLVKDLLALSSSFGPAVLFLNSDDAVLTVSEHRAELEKSYRFRLPNHGCVTALMNKGRFHRLAQQNGFLVPRSVIIAQAGDLDQLSKLKFPCVVKPSRGTPEYLAAPFAGRGHRVASCKEAEAVCHHLLSVVPGLDLIAQEWIEGPVSSLYFCLQYRADGGTVCSFTGRKLSIWPPDVGVTASCTAAPEARPILQALTEAFFETVSFAGLGGIEFKKDSRTGQFLMVEPTVGRIDGQEEVATLNGTNIPVAAYLYEVGLRGLDRGPEAGFVMWRDFFSHWRATSNAEPHEPVQCVETYDAYWRRGDLAPAFFQFGVELGISIRRRPWLHSLARSLKSAIRYIVRRRTKRHPHLTPN